MKKSVAMILAGAFTTLAVAGGTIAAAQTGVFNNSSITVQPNGEITVPEINPTESQPYTIVETQTVVITQSEPTQTAEPVAVTSNPAPSAREAELTARLNDAYTLLKQRDDLYQAKLKEAYDQIQALSAANAANGANQSQAGSSSGSGVSLAPQQQPAQQAVAHHDDNQDHHPEPTSAPENHQDGGSQQPGGDN